MAWIEDRWHVTVKRPDGSEIKEQSKRYGEGLRWRVRWVDPDGRERAKSYSRKPDADAFRSGVEADMNRGTYLDPNLGKMSLRRWAEQWLADQAVDESTREALAARIKHINAGLGGRTLAQLAASPSAVQAWVRGLNLAPSTARKCLHVLSTICSAAVDDGRMARNPCTLSSVRAPAAPKRKIEPLEAEELTALRAALPERFQAMVDAGVVCGMRQGEIFALSPGDIDFLRREIRICRQVKVVAGKMVFALPKRGKTRKIPVDDSVTVVFSEHIRAWPPRSVTLPWHEPGSHRHGKPVTVPLMFTTRVSGTALWRHNFNSGVWQPALRRAGIPVTRENGMHILRHTCGSVLLRRGVDVKRVATFLGHEDPAFTLRVYSHLMKGGDEDIRRAASSAYVVPSADLKAERS